MRQSSEQVVLLRELRESIPKRNVNQELFSDFGTDIDLTAKQQLLQQKQKSEAMHQRKL